MNNNVSNDQFNILEENDVGMRLIAFYNQLLGHIRYESFWLQNSRELQYPETDQLPLSNQLFLFIVYNGGNNPKNIQIVWQF